MAITCISIYYFVTNYSNYGSIIILNQIQRSFILGYICYLLKWQNVNRQSVNLTLFLRELKVWLLFLWCIVHWQTSYRTLWTSVYNGNRAYSLSVPLITCQLFKWNSWQVMRFSEFNLQHRVGMLSFVWKSTAIVLIIKIRQNHQKYTQQNELMK